VLVEFFGLPGSGKSTMSRCVADFVRTHGLYVDETTYEIDHRHRAVARWALKATRILLFAVAHPSRALSGFAAVLSTDQSTWTDLGKSLFNWLFVMSIASRKRLHGRVTILDQGLAQALWSVDFAARQRACFDRMLASVQQPAIKPDLVIYVRTNLRSVGSRLSARTDRASRLNPFGCDVGALQRRHAQNEAIVQKLRSGGICVIEVENDERQHLAAGAILIGNSILAILAQKKHGPEARSSMQHPGSERCQACRDEPDASEDSIPPYRQNVRRVP